MLGPFLGAPPPEKVSNQRQEEKRIEAGFEALEEARGVLGAPDSLKERGSDSGFPIKGARAVCLLGLSLGTLVWGDAY